MSSRRYAVLFLSCAAGPVHCVLLTKYVYPVCSATTWPPPSHGWISTNGTTVPYAFPTHTTSNPTTHAELATLTKTRVIDQTQSSGDTSSTLGQSSATAGLATFLPGAPSTRMDSVSSTSVSQRPEPTFQTEPAAVTTKGLEDVSPGLPYEPSSTASQSSYRQGPAVSFISGANSSPPSGYLPSATPQASTSEASTASIPFATPSSYAATLVQITSSSRFNSLQSPMISGVHTGNSLTTSSSRFSAPQESVPKSSSALTRFSPATSSPVVTPVPNAGSTSSTSSLRTEILPPPPALPQSSAEIPISLSTSTVPGEALTSIHSESMPLANSGPTTSALLQSSTPGPLVTRYSISGGNISTTVIGGTTSVYSTDGTAVTAVNGGITTTYTTGGSTQTYVMRQTPPATVAEAVIGPCPDLKGRIIDTNNSSNLVSCGIVWRGTLIVPRARKRDDDQDCSSSCAANSDCVGYSYTSDEQCRTYDYIDGEADWPSPAYSALRLQEESVVDNSSVSSISLSDSSSAGSNLPPQSAFVSYSVVTTTAPGLTITTTTVSTQSASTLIGSGDTTTVISASPTTIIR